MVAKNRYKCKCNFKYHEVKDKESIFGDSIAAELRTFSEVERCRIKHEINDILFSHQMNKFQGTPAMRIQNSQVRTTSESSYPVSIVAHTPNSANANGLWMQNIMPPQNEQCLVSATPLDRHYKYGVSANTREQSATYTDSF